MASCAYCSETATRGRICSKPKCQRRQREDWRSRDFRRRAKASTHCAHCDLPRAFKSKFCVVHQWQKNPCRGFPPGSCQCRIRRSEDGGRPRELCVKCRKKAEEARVHHS